MMVDVLSTPLGNLNIYLDGKKVPFDLQRKANDEKYFPDIDACYLLEWEYHSDFKEHKVQCVIENPNIEAESETGAELEAVAIYSGALKLTMGLTGDFGWPPESDDDFDFSGSFLRNGIEVDILKTTKTQTLMFGVAWIDGYTDDNDVQTWFAADPLTHKE